MAPRRQDDRQFEFEDPGVGQQASALAGADAAPDGRQQPGTPAVPGGGAGGEAGGGDERTVIRSGRLKGLSMWAAIWVLSWPVLTESFLNALVGLVDTTLAAGISEAATDAIGIASYFQWFIGLIAISLGVGATAMVSRAMGRGRSALAGAVAGQCVLLSGVLGITAGAALVVLAPFIANLMSLEPGSNAFRHAVDYLRIVSLGVPAVTMLFSGIACCRGAGDAVRPLVTMGVVNAVNIVVSFALAGADVAWTRVGPGGELVSTTIVPHPFPFDMGVHGIALGTLAAWWTGGFVMLAVLLRGTHGLRLRPRRLRPHWHTIRRLVRVGVPNFFETAGMWIGNFLTVLMVGWMGAKGLYGAHVVAIRIEAFSFLPGFAMATAAATLAGQYLGARRPDLAKRAILRCLVIAAGIMGLLGLAFVTIPEAIVGVFSQQAVHLELTPALLLACGIVQIPFATAIVVRGALRGAGDTRAVMLLTWVSTWGVRLPLAWLCSGVEIPLHELASLVGIAVEGELVVPNPAPLQERWDVPPLVGLWIGMCVELAIRPVFFIVRFLQGGWMRVKV